MKPLLSKEEIADLLAPLEPEPGTSPAENDIEPWPNTPLQVRVKTGHNRILRQELLQIKKDSLVTLDKFKDEPLELYVDNILVARGELVQVGGKIAIKVKELPINSEPLRKKE